MFKKNLKKNDITKALKKKTGYSFRYCEKLINDFIEISIEEIINGNLNLKNVGSFNLIFKKKRLGRNPKTKKEYLITSRKTISFKPSRKITEKLNDLYG